MANQMVKKKSIENIQQTALRTVLGTSEGLLKNSLLIAMTFMIRTAVKGGLEWGKTPTES